jgi:hypothetical protein
MIHPVENILVMSRPKCPGLNQAYFLTMSRHHLHMTREGLLYVLELHRTIIGKCKDILLPCVALLVELEQVFTGAEKSLRMLE